MEGVGRGGGGWFGRVAPGQDCLQVPTTRIHGEADDGENHQNNPNHANLDQGEGDENHHNNHKNPNDDQGEGDVDGGRDPAPHLPRLLLLPRMHPLHRLRGGQLAFCTYLG